MDYLVKEAIIKSLLMRNTNDTHIERPNSDHIRVNGIEFLPSAFIFVIKMKVYKVTHSNENNEWKELIVQRKMEKWL